MPNFHLHAVFFVMESNIAHNLESKSIEFVLQYFILEQISDFDVCSFVISYGPPTTASLFWFYYSTAKKKLIATPVPLTPGKTS